MARDPDTTQIVAQAAGDFAVLVGALSRGNFRLAEDARRRLSRRGYHVTIRPSNATAPMPTIRYFAPEAPGREVAK